MNGVVRLKLYKGNVIVVGRKSDDSLFDANIATFEEDGGAYNQADAGGFIKLNALRMRIAAARAAPSSDKLTRLSQPTPAMCRGCTSALPQALPNEET